MKNKEGYWRRSRPKLFSGSMLAPSRKSNLTLNVFTLILRSTGTTWRRTRTTVRSVNRYYLLSVLSPPSPFVPRSKLESKWSTRLRRKRKNPYEKPVTIEKQCLYLLSKKFCQLLICQVHEEGLVGKPAVRVFKVKDKPLKPFWHDSCQISWTIWN